MLVRVVSVYDFLNTTSNKEMILVRYVQNASKEKKAKKRRKKGICKGHTLKKSLEKKE